MRPSSRPASGWSSTTRTLTPSGPTEAGEVSSVLNRLSKGCTHRLGPALDRIEHVDGDVRHLYLIVLDPLTLNPVVDHDVAEGARGRDAGGAGGEQLLAALDVDML